MAKKKTGEKKGVAASIGITNLILNAITGKEDETTSEAAKSFLDFWQRKEGESIASAQNIMKMATAIGSYVVYRHVDPVPDSKIDNLAVFGGVAILLALLFVPRSTELGGRFPQFEGKLVLQKIGKKLTREEKMEILKWIRGLSNWQEKRVINLLKVKDEKGNESFDILPLKDEEVRKILLELIGDEPSLAKDVEKTVDSVTQFIKENLPEIKKEDVHVVGQKVVQHLKTTNDSLEGKWWTKSIPTLLGQLIRRRGQNA